MSQTKLTNKEYAVQEAKSVLPWLLKSGALLSALNATYTALVSLQNKEIELKTFLIGIVFTILFMVVNTAIYTVSMYMQGEK